MGISESLFNLKNNLNVLSIALVIAIGLIFSAITPPFQSPDEFAHFTRAYLLTKGQILLKKSPDGKSAGGEVDSGLVSYFNSFEKLPSNHNKKWSQEEQFSASAIKWTGQEVFMGATGTGYYFPLAYAPQALGIFLGEKLDLTLDASYQAARFFAIIFSVIVIAFAFEIFPPNSFVLGLLIIPTSIFQFTSASLDGVTTAIAVLCISIFMRGCIGKYSFPAWMSYLLAGCILILTTSRIHLLPLLAMPICIWRIRKAQVLLLQFICVTIFSLTWFVISMKATYVTRADNGFSTGQIIAFYLEHPTLLLHAISGTLGDLGHIKMYQISLIGVLGWLDASFSESFYDMTSVILLLLAIFSISLKNLNAEWKARAALIVFSFSACLLVFLALLVTWNPVPAKSIEGVQGRYFIAPLLMLGYALSGTAKFSEGQWRKAGVIPLLVLGGLVALSMPKLLVERYYLTPEQVNIKDYKVMPSAPLSEITPIKISMSGKARAERKGLKRLGVMFGTYMKQNPGRAELRLKGPNREMIEKQFQLSELKDNKYYFFELDSKPYREGEILFISGGGVSTWEAHSVNGDNEINTCLIYEYQDGTKTLTPGCPLS